MKAKDIRQLTQQEILGRIDEEEKNLSKMRFQLATSQLADTSKVSQTRQEIARLKTVLRELESAGEQNS